MEILFPKQVPHSLEVVLERVETSKHIIGSFNDDVLDFLDVLSKKLFRDARRTPALAPLAFFIRKSHTKSLGIGLKARLVSGTVGVSQGVVFHIPPTNVDTLFLYTLALSLLAGNTNIIRISKNSGPETAALLQTVFDTLDDFPNVATLTTFISFDRDEFTLTALSEVADVRMIWGGDATISNVRKSPIGLNTKDLAFPDRISISAIDCRYWRNADEHTKVSLVEALYNDTFWFDQMACSSPQQLIFVDEEAPAAALVASELALLLDAYTRERYADIEGQAVNKMVAIVKAFELGATSSHWSSNSVVTVDGVDLKLADQIRPGAGFFSTQTVSHLGEIVNQIARKVQTLTYVGFAIEELEEFADQLRGRGIDRIVPIGQALDFSTVWDGKDLLFEMHRLVTIA